MSKHAEPCPYPIPADFAESGLLLRAGQVAPRRFQVLGERSSGTNFVKRLLGRNVRLEPTEALGWKHGVLQAPVIPADLLVVVVLRHPEDWALAMHRRPWHAAAALQRLRFDAFLRTSWDSRLDRRAYFPDVGEDVARGAILQMDRDPLTGACFRDLPALRLGKLRAHLSFLNRGGAFILARMEQVVAAPEAFLRDVRLMTSAPTDAAFRPVRRRLGQKFRPQVRPRPETPDQICEADRDYLWAGLDAALEARLGYGRRSLVVPELG